MSALEDMLRAAQPIQPTCEHEIDVLRDVLRGQLGTADQRSALIRIIKQNTPDVHTRKGLVKLMTNLRANPATRNSYFA